MDTIFILENEKLGTWWVGKSTLKMNTNGFPIHRSLTQDQLEDILDKKYIQYLNPRLNLCFMNKTYCFCYGIERWLSHLDYEIKRKPDKYNDLKKLLTAGWHENETIPHSTIYVINVQENMTQKIYNDLKKNWGNPKEKSSKLRSPYTLKMCLNATTCLTRKERYEKNKQNPEFLKEQAQKKLLYRISKGYVPKCKTLEKYNLSKPDQIEK